MDNGKVANGSDMFTKERIEIEGDNGLRAIKKE
jgi:hypothetical protein